MDKLAELRAQEHEAMAAVNDRYVMLINETHERTDGRSSTANVGVHRQSAAKHRRIAAQIRRGEQPRWHEPPNAAF